MGILNAQDLHALVTPDGQLASFHEEATEPSRYIIRGSGSIDRGLTTVWIDADGCPAFVRDIVVRAIHGFSEYGVRAIFVSNSPLVIQTCEHVHNLHVLQSIERGPEKDSVDDVIFLNSLCRHGVITNDGGLVARIGERHDGKILAINFRGEIWERSDDEGTNSEDVSPYLLEAVRGVERRSRNSRKFDQTARSQFGDALHRLVVMLLHIKECFPGAEVHT